MSLAVLTLNQIQLRVEIDQETGSAVFDFAGTGCEVRGNLNAPMSVVHSAVIYCMRAMLDVDIPLNAGCLVPLDGACVPWKSISLTLPSANSPGIVAVTLSYCCRVRWKCTDVSAHRRRCVESIPCVCCQPGMHQVSDLIFDRHVSCCSNVTFGTGGKNSDGVAVSGWGYYEASLFGGFIAVLTCVDHRGWVRRRAWVAWHIRGPHAHYQHAYR